MIEKVKVRKDLIVKEIQKKDLPQYIAMGWQEVKENNFIDYTQKYKKVV